MILPDVLEPNLKVIFCGTAASTISASRQAYYANPGNYFWRTLHAVGLTPYHLKPAEFPQLPQYHIGLTDIAKFTSGNDNQLEPADFNRDELLIKIHQYQPTILAFTSKRAASEALERPTSHIQYGWQTDHIAETRLFVLPSPSGAARAFWDITYWQQLAYVVLSLPNKSK